MDLDLSSKAAKPFLQRKPGAFLSGVKTEAPQEQGQGWLSSQASLGLTQCGFNSTGACALGLDKKHPHLPASGRAVYSREPEAETKAPLRPGGSPALLPTVPHSPCP